ncbi:MAG: ATP-binding cassette domain-containing protein, partial [Nitrososphaerota archaeon]|nr:ATP-binding cassette domain-containing protein [Nitrososphaerota archaeon]
MPLIEFENVKKEYIVGGVRIAAVEDCSFSIEQGELAVILGPSGAGKTTILNLLGGMDSPSGGHIFVGGNKVHEYSKKQLVEYRRRDIGFVFQFYNLVGN